MREETCESSPRKQKRTERGSAGGFSAHPGSRKECAQGDSARQERRAPSPLRARPLEEGFSHWERNTPSLFDKTRAQIATIPEDGLGRVSSSRGAVTPERDRQLGRESAKFGLCSRSRSDAPVREAVAVVLEQKEGNHYASSMIRYSHGSFIFINQGRRIAIGKLPKSRVARV